jgi:hypothetical protein
MQGTWVNDPHFAGLRDIKDPIMGDRNAAAPQTTMVIPKMFCREKVHGILQFVTLRSGGYFFLPHLAALEYLASLTQELIIERPGTMYHPTVRGA